MNQQNYNVGDKLEATLTLTNIDVGHYFPTYVTVYKLFEKETPL